MPVKKEIEKLSSLLKKEGVIAFGIAEAAPVDDTEWSYFEEWLSKGYNAGMKYMENYPEIRKDPRLLLPGARSIISVAYNYRQPNPYHGVSTYALGEDYHKVIRKRLKRVVNEMEGEFGGDWRICIDSAPVLERYWAVKCGLGVRSQYHGNVIVEGAGSMIFLAEIISTLEFPPVNENFIEARLKEDFIEARREPKYPSIRNVCPTEALQGDGSLDARCCINYLTIEHQGELTIEEKRMVGDSVFGCDVCQKVCPENRGEYIGVIDEFKPLPGLKEFIEGKGSEFPLSKSPLKRSKRFKSH